jgi:Mitochondrial carrier protein
MGGGGGADLSSYPKQYFCASALAAAINYPLWRSAAIGQSGFSMATLNIAGRTVPTTLAPYVYGFLPPYKGMMATVLGMTYARAAIFYGSDHGRAYLLQHDLCSEATATVVPPLLIGTLVQVINQPLVRSTVTLQDPNYNLPNVIVSMRHIYASHGIAGLWHGTTAGVLKTVPKYCTAIAVKDYMEKILPQPDASSPTYETDRLWRSAIKSATAGVAGAALTNPLDVIRNEQFKTHLGLRATIVQLWREMGYGFLTRGMMKNMVAVAMPVGMTLFFTDAFIQFSQDAHLLGPKR